MHAGRYGPAPGRTGWCAIWYAALGIAASRLASLADGPTHEAQPACSRHAAARAGLPSVPERAAARQASDTAYRRGAPPARCHARASRPPCAGRWSLCASMTGGPGHRRRGLARPGPAARDPCCARLAQALISAHHRPRRQTLRRVLGTLASRLDGTPAAPEYRVPLAPEPPRFGSSVRPPTHPQAR
jgi:hypothetical protein